MQEVVAHLRFIRESLGRFPRRTRSNQVVYEMPRDAAGRLIFHFQSAWWRERMQYAAQLCNYEGNLVARIHWDPAVDGSVVIWKRVLVSANQDPKGRRRFAVHEAFPPGGQIRLRAVLPEGLAAEQFQRLLAMVGTYRGLSPFVANEETYGTFEVLSVRPAVGGA